MQNKGRGYLNVENLFAPTCTVTILTSIKPELEAPVHYESRQGTNTQWDFLGFLVRAISDAFLKPHSIVVLDNAKFHHGRERNDDLQELVRRFNIMLIFDPLDR